MIIKRTLITGIVFTSLHANIAVAHHELQNRNLMAGSENYQEHCASCHGINLEGQPNWREYKADEAFLLHRMTKQDIHGIMIPRCSLNIRSSEAKRR